jgi:hypothetical protein
MFNQRFAGQRKSWVIGGIAGAMLLSIAVVFAQDPLPQAPQVALGTGFTYQRQLKKNGAAVTGACGMTFSLWDSQFNGTGQVGVSQLINPVAVANGLFTTLLNGSNQFGSSAFTGQDRWLQTIVQCTGDVGTTMLSRQQLSAAPYALFSAAPWVTNGSKLTYSAGLVGIGTSAPVQSLQVDGTTSLGPPGSVYGYMVTGVGLPGPNYPTLGFNTYDSAYLAGVAGYGGIFQFQDGAGKLVYYTGSNVAAGFPHGITPRFTIDLNGDVGIGSSPNDIGKLEVTAAAGQTGVYASGNTGVYGSGVNSGIGVSGHSTSNVGVNGSSDNGSGVYGSGNIGVSGYSGSNIGVYGASGNIGVEGFSSSGSAVYGYSSGGGTGVHGGSATGYSGYFDGKVHVTGLLEKAGGGFKIDHPLDPANQYLYHSFVESPDMMDVYNGNVTTDEHGDATVVLPEWFEALNRDFRYQLTVVGKQWAQARVEEEIQDNRFSIKTDKPNVKVSWQVTGIRHDPWAEQHRIPVEEEKPPAERGKYLHPKEYGQPETLGLDYDNLHALTQGAPSR